MGSLHFLNSAPQATGQLFLAELPLLTSLMGALGSLFGPLAQSADHLTHQEGKQSPAVGPWVGPDHQLGDSKKTFRFLSPITDSQALSLPVREFLLILQGSSQQPPPHGNTSLIPRLG